MSSFKLTLALVVTYLISQFHYVYAFTLNVIHHCLTCATLGRKLYDHVRRGTKTWVLMLSRLLIFTTILLPGWYKMVKYWLLSPLVIKNLEYGAGARKRNLLDIYLPPPSQYDNNSIQPTTYPVVIFFSGGAWIIGYKMWSCLVGRALSKLGILTIVPDYRNFPQGNIEDMMTDVRSAVCWTVRNAHRFNGDPNNIILAGQSAGAHICLCTLVDAFQKDHWQELSGDDGRSQLTTLNDNPPLLIPPEGGYFAGADAYPSGAAGKPLQSKLMHVRDTNRPVQSGARIHILSEVRETSLITFHCRIFLNFQSNGCIFPI